MRKISQNKTNVTGVSPYGTGELKSGAQKFIRRAMVTEALATVNRLYEQAPESLFRRLPIIAIEDIGFDVGAPVFYECKRLFEEMKQGANVKHQMFQITSVLCGMDKDQDCAGLGNLAELKGTVEGTVADMEDAIGTGNELTANQIAQWLVSNKQKQKMWDALLGMAQQKGSWHKWNMTGLRGRVSQGMMASDEIIYIAGAIQVLLRGAKQARLFDWEKVSVSDVPDEITIPWYGLDFHTRCGRMAISALTKKEFLYNDLLYSWWYYESALVNKQVGNWFETEKEARGFSNRSAEWKNKTRPAVKAMVEWAMQKKNLPIPTSDETQNMDDSPT